MASDFVHLHVHTDFSLLDGACQIKKLVERAKLLEMKALAITDHGNMCGAVEFYDALKEKGIKPIIGCEFYLAPDKRTIKNTNHPKHRGFHQILYARDLEGYRNLCRLNAKAHLEGYYFNARIDKEVLAQHSQGLLATSSCLGGEVPFHILQDNLPMARKALGEYLDILGRDNYYLELQDHGIEEQKKVNEVLLELAREFNLPLIATNDVHYLLKEHAESHDVLLCIGMQTTVNDPKRMKFDTKEFYLKSGTEMETLFKEVPQAITRTAEIAERCTVILPKKESHYPIFTTPNGEDRRQYLTDLCCQALVERYGINVSNGTALSAEQQAIVDRMHFEIGIIDRMGFVSYFLVVWDFLHYARRQGIAVGPGRGSGAGSLVAYLLHITDIEPLRYNLLFERFLNPERVSPPDFDIDLCERRRVEVIQYVRQRYGEENVAQIGTFGTLKAKQVAKDVARALGRSFADGNQLTKLIPADPKMTIQKAQEDSSELREFLEREPWAQEVFKMAEPLEGLSRNNSIHAAGLLIGDQPLTNLVPLQRGANDEVITQYAAAPCESLGLLKMDFLGLSTLTIIQDTCDLLRKSQKLELHPDHLPLDEPNTYKLLSEGHTVCVFQLESGGMQALCRQWGPKRVEDIIALIALYRPGPLDHKDLFLANRAHPETVHYDLPELRPILEETSGIMLYQEQVMQVCQRAAGFTLGQADILRRAMGKKKQSEMDKMKEDFMAGCAKKGHTTETATAIWANIEKFAGYGFNKSHSAAYAVLAIRTAYLKANYPVEFMAANLTNEMGSADRVSELIAACRDMGIKVLPPDVNSSDMNFSVDQGAIRFGLGAIKGVGTIAAEAIIKARETARYTTLNEFCERVGGHVNRRTLEALCQSGAFDGFGLKRAQLFAMLDESMNQASAAVKDRERGQATFFDILASDTDQPAGPAPPPDLPEWSQRELLRYEKDLLGFYVTGHPLDEYRRQLETFSTTSISKLASLPDGQGVRLGGLISTVTRKVSKKDGRPWAIVLLEDFTGSTEVLVFSETYATVAAMLEPAQVIFIEGFVSKREEERTSLQVQKVMALEAAEEQYTEELLVGVSEKQATPETLDALKRLLSEHRGGTRTLLALGMGDGQHAVIELGRRYHITFNEQVRQGLRRLLGERSFKPRANLTVPTRKSFGPRPPRPPPAE